MLFLLLARLARKEGRAGGERGEAWLASSLNMQRTEIWVRYGSTILSCRGWDKACNYLASF